MTLRNSMVGLKSYLIAKATGALGKSFKMHKEIGLLGAMATQRKTLLVVYRVEPLGFPAALPTRLGLLSSLVMYHVEQLEFLSARPPEPFRVSVIDGNVSC